MSAGGTSPAARTAVPVWILPPSSSSSIASASVIARDPPSATGHPWRWPAAMIVRPMAEVSGRWSGTKPCAATPPNSARAFSVCQRRAVTEAGSNVPTPKRASLIGWSGTCAMGRIKSSARSSKAREARPKVRRHRSPSGPRPAAVSSTDRNSRPASPESSGWAQSISGHRHCNPYRSRPRRAEVGRADAHGVERRAVVVQDTGQGQLAGAGAAADVVGRLEHGDVEAVLGQPDGGGEPVRARADHDGGAHCPTSTVLGHEPDFGAADRRRRVHVAWSGMGPSGSHGNSATASATR